MERVEELVDGKKLRGVAGAQTVGQFGEGEAVAKEAKFDLGIVEGGEDVKNRRDLLHAGAKDVPGIRDIPNGSAEERKAGGGTPRSRGSALSSGASFPVQTRDFRKFSGV